MSRRDALRVGALAAFGLGAHDLLRLRAATPSAPSGIGRRARSCILVWLDGGPSHLDTFDPKRDAPREVRGPFGSIPTAVPGLHFCELLPETARLADRLAIVRSVTSPLGEHNLGSHYLLTGYRPTAALEYPSLGSVRARFTDAPSVLPTYIAVGNRRNPASGAGYLPPEFAPFSPGGDPADPRFRVRDLDFYPELDGARLRARRDLLAEIDRQSRLADSGAVGDLPSDLDRAYRLVTSPDARRAFDLSEERDATRDRYGRRTLGAACLLARRLVERGVPFVTVTDTGWDTHEALVRRLEEGYTGGAVGKIPVLDRALSALIRDLDERGLLSETLVVVMGEFGRTPKITTAGGRDHWPRVFSVLLAGACVPRGLVLGESDAIGESPADEPVTPADLAHTIFVALGIDPHAELRTADGRPVRLTRESREISALLAR